MYKMKILNFRLFRLVHDKRLSIPVLRCFHHEFTKPEPEQKTNKEEQTNSPKTTRAVLQRYKVFNDADATEILDINEERIRYDIQDEEDDEFQDAYHGLNLKRGVNGVYEIEDLVDVLRKEAAEDIFVCTVPKEFKYVDYIVVCSGRSYRHMLATAEFVRRIYKIKRDKGDIYPKIEGENSHDWMALDLGNIALHIFSPRAREEYDLESLWAIGAKYDKQSNQPLDPLTQLLEKNTKLFF